VTDPTRPMSSNEAYVQLLSLAVHELRTPASVVGGYLRMLQRDTDSPLSERQRRMVDEAERSCQRLVGLIGELSEIQKLDANLTSFATQPFDLFTVIGEVAKAVHAADDRNLRLELRGPDAGASVRGDSGRLQQAFSAIFRAILREVPDGTHMVADRRTERHGGATLALVAIGEETSVQLSYEAEREPFDEKRGGLGLALPIARRIIERHGGSVWSPAGETGRRTAVVSVPVVVVE